jgi:hypothetical protein
MIKQSVNYLVKCAKSTLEMFLLLIGFTRIVPNEILHIQRTAHKAVIPFYKLAGSFKSEHFH